MDASVEESWRGERRVRLLDAASRIFSRHAYEAASMDEIAHEAGVGKPTLYRYFPSKEALFAAVFIDALDALEARLHAVLDTRSGLEERVHGLVAAIVPTFRDHLVSLRMLGADEAAVDASKRRIFRERRARIARFLARAIEEGVTSGEATRPIDPSRIAQMMIGMIWSAAVAIRADDSEIADDVTALVLHGVGLKVSGASRPGHLASARPISDPSTKRSGSVRSREAQSA